MLKNILAPVPECHAIFRQSKNNVASTLLKSVFDHYWPTGFLSGRQWSYIDLCRTLAGNLNSLSLWNMSSKHVQTVKAHQAFSIKKMLNYNTPPL